MIAFGNVIANPSDVVSIFYHARLPDYEVIADARKRVFEPIDMIVCYLIR